MYAESKPGTLIVGLADATGAGSSFSGDPEAAPALIFSTVGPGSDDPEERSYVQGVTRAEVARVDWIRPSGTVSVRTIENDAFPQLRFFLIEDPDSSVTRGSAPFLAAHAADGTLLTDYKRIAAEQR